MNTGKYYDLSNPQKRIWLTELINNRQEMSNIGYLIELKGSYDLNILAKAVKYAFKINPGLQLKFKYQNEETGDLVQTIPEYNEIDVEIIETKTEEELMQKIDAKHRQRFDITNDTLCAFAVFSINNERFGFFEKAHHLVADGVSATIVSRETIAAYNQMMNNTFEEINKEIDYTDFLEAEKEYIDSPKYQKSKEYWTERFKDFHGEDITFDFNQNKKNSLIVKRHSCRIPQEKIKLVEEYKTEKRLSYFALFMAALAVYFNRYHSHDDMIIGMPVHNRNKKTFKEMVGMFVSTLPLRLTVESHWTFTDLIADIKRQLWDALKHQAYPFNHLVKDLKGLGIGTDGLLNVQLIELPGAGDDAIDKRAFFSTAYNITQLSIYLNLQNRKELQELEVAIDYHADIFDEREVAALFKRLMVILEQGITQPDTQLSQLSLLEESEYNELVNQLNDTAAPFPKDKTLPQLFAQQVTRNPEAIALEYEDKTVTYKELNDITDKLAVKLQDAGVKPDTIVGILCERSIDAVVGIWATLKAGGAYLPIDREYPPERINYIIENSGLKVLLMEKDTAESGVFQDNPAVTTMTVDYAALTAEPAGNPLADTGLTSDNLAYVIYTSGTTGKPKGTLLRHRNAINYIWWGAKHYVNEQTMTFPLFTSLSFDLTVTSLFIPMVTGNKLVIYRDYQDGLLIEKVVRDNKVNIIKLTPSHLKIIRELKCDVSAIKSFILGGEELRTDTARETHDFFGGNINIYNEYGPTETAVGCMIHRYDPEMDTDAAVPIGKPSDNVQIYILDIEKRLMPVGIVGEIYISGAGVAKGYLHNQPLTDERFVDNPFVPGTKMYKSGDLGRWNLDKKLEFFGRCDEQVKIRGFRIEPGEIEKQLMNLEAVKDAVVVVVEKGGQKSLCAYMVAHDEYKSTDPDTPSEALSAKTIRKELAKNIPDYMIPAFFVEMDKIPLTTNGKVNKRALPEPKAQTTADTMPTGQLEETIVKIWSDVLGMETLGMEDNFFELGGDSIKAVQISSRMNDIELSVNARDILEFQTVSQLIANVDFDREKKTYNQGLIEGKKEPSPIENWFFEKNYANPHHYNLSVLLDFELAIDHRVMVECFNRLIRHHDALRVNADIETKTLFYNNSHLEKDVQIDIFEISNDDAGLMEVGEKIKSSFNLKESLLVKPAILRSASGKDRLLITAHHLIIDGVSWRVLLEDLYNLYRGISKGEEVTLPKKTASLIDWRNHLQEYSQQDALKSELDHWNAVIDADYPITGKELAPEDAGVIADRARVGFELDVEQSETLSTGARKTFNSDIEVLLVTALGLAMKEFTGKDGSIIEMENYGRVLEGIDLSRTVGWFTAMYPGNVIIDKDDLVGVIKSVKEQLSKIPNRGIGYGILKYLTGQLPGNYLSQVRFNYLGQFDSEVSNDLFSYCDLKTGTDIAKDNVITALIEVNCMLIGGRLAFDLDYSSTVFDKNRIDGLLEKVKSSLAEMVKYFETGGDEVHFTSSDFDTVDLDDDDLDALFG